MPQPPSFANHLGYKGRKGGGLFSDKIPALIIWLGGLATMTMPRSDRSAEWLQSVGLAAL